MPGETALLDAIAAAPDDDGPRQVYADWLDEQGRATEAARLRTQLTLWQTIDGDPWADPDTLVARAIAAEAHLPRPEEVPLVADGHVDRVGYRRGLLEVVELTDPDEGLLEALPATVRELRIVGAVEGDVSSLQRVEAIRWRGEQTDAQLTAIGRLPRLRELALSGHRGDGGTEWTDQLAPTIMEALRPAHERLRSLSLTAPELGRIHWELPRLRALELTGLIGRSCRLGSVPTGLRTLRLHGLLTLPEGVDGAALEELALGAQVVSWPELPALRHLQLRAIGRRTPLETIGRLELVSLTLDGHAPDEAAAILEAAGRPCLRALSLTGSTLPRPAALAGLYRLELDARGAGCPPRLLAEWLRCAPRALKMDRLARGVPSLLRGANLTQVAVGHDPWGIAAPPGIPRQTRPTRQVRIGYPRALLRTGPILPD